MLGDIVLIRHKVFMRSLKGVSKKNCCCRMYVYLAADVRVFEIGRVLRDPSIREASLV